VPRLPELLRHAATALAVVAMLMWAFRVHGHVPVAAGGHADHSSEACGILGLLDGDLPEPADDGDHCDCPGTACAPPQHIAVTGDGSVIVDRLRVGSLAIPEGQLPQPDPPPVRSV